MVYIVDLQGGTDKGRFFAIIKKTTQNNDGTFNEVYSDSISATEPVKKVLKSQNSTLGRTLDQMSVVALVKLNLILQNTFGWVNIQHLKM